VKRKRSPFRVDAYCGCCHGTREHRLREDRSYDHQDCFECECGHLVFVPKGEAESLGVCWYETARRKHA
jgi:hypothetical protein